MGPSSPVSSGFFLLCLLLIQTIELRVRAHEKTASRNGYETPL